MKKIISENEFELEKQEQIERGKRIKDIRENQLHITKTELAKQIGISSQFLGLVEDGKGNLVYSSLKKLRDLTGLSSDYILFGIDDKILDNTKILLENYNDKELSDALKIIHSIALFIKNNNI
jgi:predicted transcriptional regulator